MSSLLSYLPEHVFLRICDFLSITDLNQLEESHTTIKPTKFGETNMMQLAFERLTELVIYGFDYSSTLEDLTTNFVRYDNNLREIKIYNEKGDNVVSYLIDTELCWFEQLLQCLPKIEKFHYDFWSDHCDLIAEYVADLEGNSCIKKIVINRQNCLNILNSNILQKSPLINVIDIDMNCSCDNGENSSEIDKYNNYDGHIMMQLFQLLQENQHNVKRLTVHCIISEIRFRNLIDVITGNIEQLIAIFQATLRHIHFDFYTESVGELINIRIRELFPEFVKNQGRISMRGRMFFINLFEHIYDEQFIIGFDIVCDFVYKINCKQFSNLKWLTINTANNDIILNLLNNRENLFPQLSTINLNWKEVHEEVFYEIIMINGHLIASLEVSGEFNRRNMINSICDNCCELKHLKVWCNKVARKSEHLTEYEIAKLILLPVKHQASVITIERNNYNWMKKCLDPYDNSRVFFYTV